MRWRDESPQLRLQLIFDVGISKGVGDRGSLFPIKRGIGDLLDVAASEAGNAQIALMASRTRRISSSFDVSCSGPELNLNNEKIRRLSPGPDPTNSGSSVKWKRRITASATFQIWWSLSRFQPTHLQRCDSQMPFRIASSNLFVSMIMSACAVYLTAKWRCRRLQRQSTNRNQGDQRHSRPKSRESEAGQRSGTGIVFLSPGVGWELPAMFMHSSLD